MKEFVSEMSEYSHDSTLRFKYPVIAQSLPRNILIVLICHYNNINTYIQYLLVSVLLLWLNEIFK